MRSADLRVYLVPQDSRWVYCSLAADTSPLCTAINANPALAVAKTLGAADGDERTASAASSAMSNWSIPPAVRAIVAIATATPAYGTVGPGGFNRTASKNRSR